MAHCCSQCSFTAQFESALNMHRQLHHENGDVHNSPDITKPRGLQVSLLRNSTQEKSNTVPCVSPSKPTFLSKEKDFKLPTRTSSATKLFEKFRTKICRSRMFLTHREETAEVCANRDMSALSECTSKALKDEVSSPGGVAGMKDIIDTYGCHLCDFDTDRITVLDRHLLNDHKIGLENLLKLVMAKTKDSLSEESVPIFAIRQPYYKLDEIIENGEFVIQTVTPKIKILKHAATNTDIVWNNLYLKSHMMEELDQSVDYPSENKLSEKIKTLSECMCKFVDSSNTLKKVIAKELDAKTVKERRDEELFNLGLGDRDMPREWERAHSERMERTRKKYDDNRNDKTKFSSDSFCF